AGLGHGTGQLERHAAGAAAVVVTRHGTRVRPTSPAVRSGGRFQVGRPLRVSVVLGADEPPVSAAWHHRGDAERPPQLLHELVGLTVVARRARGDAVLPGVGAATGSGDDVVDGLGPLAA